jgi:hypothetical protein
MTSQENIFSIRRPLSEESVSDISAITDNLDVPELRTRNKDGLGASLVNRGAMIYHLNKRGILTTHERYKHIFHPPIKSSLASIEMQVKDITYLGRSIGRASIALVLADPDGILDNEHNHYVKRIQGQNRVGVGDFIPHVSIGSLPSEYGTKSILSSIEPYLPETVNLMPVTTKHPHYLPIDMQVANGLISPEDAERKKYPHYERAHTVLELRQLLSHPMNFLNSIRNDHAIKDEYDTIEG